MKRIINTLFLLSVAMMAMAQTSFVVTDKNGNSQFVQGLIFQQQQNADRFTWKSNGSASGDIKDLLFVARAHEQLATASSNDVTEMLEELSGTDLVDAEAIAAALKKNPNVEEAYTEDGDNLIVKNKDSEGDVVYPMYEMMSPFSEIEVPEQANYSKQKRIPRKAFKQYPKVAIFNFFEDMDQYKVQNLITRNIEWDFYQKGYDVDYYTPNNSNPSLRFTYENLGSVIHSSKKYAAIIIMTHGARVDGKSCLCTGELAGENDESLYNWADRKYYKRYYADIQAESNCILYLGICNGLSKDGFNSMSPTIGYSGPTRMAQANAAMIFYLMLNEGYSLEKACTLPSEPAPYQNTKIFKSKNVGSQTLESETTWNYMEGCSVKYVLANKDNYSLLRGWFEDNNSELSQFGKAELVPILFRDINMVEDYYDYYHDNRTLINIPFMVEDGSFEVNFVLYHLPENIYICRIMRRTKSGLKLVEPDKYRFRIVSENFNVNSAEVEATEESVTAPSILDTGGQPTEEITVAAGSNKTFEIDGYKGHSFRAISLDDDIATVSVSGSSLTVTGIAEGTTYIGVQDLQNRKIAVAEVNVTAGGGASYTSCPDSHHPHLIDLGLPSGTKWACCNVGAQKPEDYGGYFAWGETTEKSRYYWDTYIHCDGSSSTCHDIGNDIAGTQYDAATANWGSPWVMPNKDQMNELKDKCTSEWTAENGVNGRRFTGPNGASIFLPAAAYRWEDELDSAGSRGDYWSSTLYESLTGYSWYLYFYSGFVYTIFYDRYHGLSVRPVVQQKTSYMSSCPDNNHPHMIDLGLPSGTKWACCNVGARYPEDYGGYYAWGETEEKSNYAQWNYLDGKETSYFIGNDIAGTQYDAATANWGTAWVMPNMEQIQELIKNCTSEWTTENGVNGRRFTGPNGASIFLPAAGERWYEDLDDVGSEGEYWSSSFGEDESVRAYGLLFYEGYVHWYGSHYYRQGGHPVRPVVKY